MSKTKRKLQLSVAFTALIVTAFSIGCNGFFVDPTLQTITVTPTTPAVVAGNTLQMIATGSYNDGSTKNISGSVTWTTDDTSIATISSTGLLTGVSQGKVTITATSATISGPTTATIQVAGLQSITLDPPSASISSAGTQAFKATGHLQNGDTPDLSDSVTWNSSDVTVATIDTGGLATALTVTQISTTTITATSGTVSATATLTVSP